MVARRDAGDDRVRQRYGRGDLGCGRDPSQTIAASVTASGPAGSNTFTVLRNYGPSSGAYVDASEPQLAGLGTTERSDLSVPDWSADQFTTKPDDPGPPRTVVIATRGEAMNLYIFGDFPAKELRTLLSALP